MKKVLIALTFLVTLFSPSIVSFAADTTSTAAPVATVNKLMLSRFLGDDFAVSTQLKALVFTNMETGKDFDSIIVDLIDTKNDSKIAYTANYKVGSNRMVTYDLKGVPDGTYVVACRLAKGTSSSLNVSSFYMILKDSTVGLKEGDYYSSNVYLELTARTDIYALDAYKNKGIFTEARCVSLVNQAQSIVAGITDDYAKVKAIHDWVANNTWYDYDAYYGKAGRTIVAAGEKSRGICDDYERWTTELMIAAGFPAKRVGGWVPSPKLAEEGHVWTEVYVNNRWVFMDTTWDSNNGYHDGVYSDQRQCDHKYFDTTIAQFSVHHKMDDQSFYKQDSEKWDGSLCFYDYTNDKALKTVPNIQMGLLTSTYGFDLNDMYIDNGKTHWNMAAEKINSTHWAVFVKRPYIVKYGVQFDPGYGGTFGGVSTYLYDIPEGSKINPPTVTPTKDGYTFGGWYKDEACTKVWNFVTDVVPLHTGELYRTYQLDLYAKWVKNGTTATKPSEAKYTVTFNSQDGTKVSAITNITKDAKVSAPKVPTKKGYTFIAWYKDGKFTEVWNFKTDTVSSNTLLYAKWKKK